LPEWEVEHQIWLESFKVETRKQYPAQFTGVNRSGSTVRHLPWTVPTKIRPRAQYGWSVCKAREGEGKCEEREGWSCNDNRSLQGIECALLHTYTLHAALAIIRSGVRISLQEADTSSMWQPAPRTTEADDTNAMRSTNRRLDQRLLLLLKSPGTNYRQLPAFKCCRLLRHHDMSHNDMSAVTSSPL
jgi:hypothetical protein